MSDQPKPPEPTLASMTDEQRMAYARSAGSAAYSARLLRESTAARAATPAQGPYAAMAAIQATRGLAESERVDLASLDAPTRDAWIQRHGVKRYDALLRQQLKGRTTILGRRR